MTLAGVPEPRRCCSASRRPRRCSSACRRLLSLCSRIGTTTPRLHARRENHRTGKTHRRGTWGEGEERRTHGETRTGKTIAAEKHTAEAHWVGKQPFHTTDECQNSFGSQQPFAPPFPRSSAHDGGPPCRQMRGSPVLLSLAAQEQLTMAGRTLELRKPRPRPPQPQPFKRLAPAVLLSLAEVRGRGASS